MIYSCSSTLVLSIFYRANVQLHRQSNARAFRETSGGILVKHANEWKMNNKNRKKKKQKPDTCQVERWKLSTDDASSTLLSLFLTVRHIPNLLPFGTSYTHTANQKPLNMSMLVYARACNRIAWITQTPPNSIQKWIVFNFSIWINTIATRLRAQTSERQQCACIHASSSLTNYLLSLNGEWFSFLFHIYSCGKCLVWNFALLAFAAIRNWCSHCSHSICDISCRMIICRVTSWLLQSIVVSSNSLTLFVPSSS